MPRRQRHHRAFSACTEWWNAYRAVHVHGVCCLAVMAYHPRNVRSVHATWTGQTVSSSHSSAGLRVMLSCLRAR